MLWRRYGRKHRSVFDGDYYRDLPANYSPAELSVLWNFKAMNANDITATIMDLARRQFLFLEEDTVQAVSYTHLLLRGGYIILIVLLAS